MPNSLKIALAASNPQALVQAADGTVESALLSKCGAQDTDRDVLPEVVLQFGEDPDALFEALRRPIEAARCRVRVAEIIERHRLSMTVAALPGHAQHELVEFFGIPPVRAHQKEPVHHLGDPWDELGEGRGVISHLVSCRQQVYSLVLEPRERLRAAGDRWRACAQSDKAAQCFNTVATLNPMGPGTPAARAQDRTIECGLDVAAKGLSLLADAESEGSKIQAEAG